MKAVVRYFKVSLQNQSQFGLGVGKNEKVFSATLTKQYEDNKEEVKSYFESQLSSRNIANYEVEVLINIHDK
jgi:hypothetical protein